MHAVFALMAEVTASSMIDAFLTDLRNLSASIAGGAAAETTTLHLWAPGANTVQWRADEDYFLTDVVSESGSVQWALTLDGTTYTQNFQSSGSGKKGTLLAVPATSTSQSRQPQRTRIPKDHIIYFTNNSASNAAVLLVLERAPSVS